jgi:hypothetical protein
LYSKSKVHVDVEKVKPYYMSLIKKVSIYCMLITKNNEKCINIENIHIFLNSSADYKFFLLFFDFAVFPGKLEVVNSVE